MPRYLSQLIADDLAKLADFNQEKVASEEAIRWMLAVYASQLQHVRLIHVDNLYSFLQQGLAEQLAIPGHYQLMVEVDKRSLYAQGDPNDIHYFAMDLYIRPGKKPMLLMADHYRGHDEKGYYPCLAKIASDLPIHLAMVGGQLYQVDEIHCMIFSLQHLLLTAQDKNLILWLETCIAEQAASSAANSITYIDWFQMAPQYLLHAQSLKSTLFNYVAFQKQRSGRSAADPCPILESSQFDIALSSTLEVAADSRVLNKGIKYTAARLAQEAAQSLISPDRWTEVKLLAICYEEAYPSVYQLLKKAANLTAQAHPLLELAFYHAQVLAICLKNPNFLAIFNNEQLLLIMAQGKLSPQALFARLTEQPEVRDTLADEPSHNPEILINEAQCKLLLRNIWMLDYLDQYPTLEAEDVVAVLFSPILLLLKEAVANKMTVDTLLASIRPDAFSSAEFQMASLARSHSSGEEVGNDQLTRSWSCDFFKQPSLPKPRETYSNSLKGFTVSSAS